MRTKVDERIFLFYVEGANGKRARRKAWHRHSRVAERVNVQFAFLASAADAFRRRNTFVTDGARVVAERAHNADFLHRHKLVIAFRDQAAACPRISACTRRSLPE